MNFVSYKNQLNFDCIDFKNNTIGFIVGNFVDYNFIGEVIRSPELSDSVDKEVLKQAVEDYEAIGGEHV